MTQLENKKLGANITSPDQYQLRFPVGMRDRLKAVAEANSRSMNAEIIARLEESFKDQTMSSDLLAMVTKQLDSLQDMQEFMVGTWEDALKELEETGRLSEEHRKFVTEMTKAMRKQIASRPNAFE